MGRTGSAHFSGCRAAQFGSPSATPHSGLRKPCLCGYTALHPLLTSHHRVSQSAYSRCRCDYCHVSQRRSQSIISRSQHNSPVFLCHLISAILLSSALVFAPPSTHTHCLALQYIKTIHYASAAEIPVSNNSLGVSISAQLYSLYLPQSVQSASTPISILPNL